MLTARVLPPSLKTENRTLRPVTAPSGCLTHPLELQTELRRQPCLRSTYILQPQPPGLQHLSVSFTAAFPLQAAHSPLKKPSQAGRRPSPGSMQNPPGALTGSPGGGDTSSAGTGLLGTGASPGGPGLSRNSGSAGSIGGCRHGIPAEVIAGAEGVPRPERLSS